MPHLGENVGGFEHCHYYIIPHNKDWPEAVGINPSNGLCILCKLERQFCFWSTTSSNQCPATIIMLICNWQIRSMYSRHQVQLMAQTGAKDHKYSDVLYDDTRNITAKLKYVSVF
jgi:hypothetical protein